MAKHKSTEQLKKEMGAKRKKDPPIKTSDLLSTGSTLLNLSCSGRAKGAIPKGKYVLMAGESSAGKTWLANQILAEAAKNPHFDEHELYYDDAEGGMMVDREEYFGSKAASRIKDPHKYGASRYIEDFYDKLDNLIDAGKPFVYVLDSQDSLTTKQEQKKKKQQKNQRSKGEEETGAMTEGKAKLHSGRIKDVASGLIPTGSILIILAQVRDNMGFGAKFNPKVRSGGNALRFYNRLEWWLSSGGRVMKTVRGKKRDIGINTVIKIKKNHVTGRLGRVEFPILWSYGVDDLGSCIDFLVDEKHWTERNGVLKAAEFDFEGSRAKLIKMIEKEEMEKDLQDTVAVVWREIDEASKAKRKPRYV